MLTYTAGFDAVTVVWIAAQFSEQHRAALDWRNRVTNESIDLFGLEIELWLIGNSPLAPKFNTFSRPNSWQKTVTSTTGSSGQLS